MTVSARETLLTLVAVYLVDNVPIVPQSYFAAAVMRHYLKGDACNPPRQVVYQDQADGRVRLIVPDKDVTVFQADSVHRFSPELDDAFNTVYICDCGAATPGQLGPVRRAAYRTIVISSPNPLREHSYQNEWQTATRAIKFFMPSWSRDEVRASVPHIWPERKLADGSCAYDRRVLLHGGIPRTVFDPIESDEALEGKLMRSIQGCDLTAITTGEYTGNAHLLRLLHNVVGPESDYKVARLGFVSDFIAEKVVAEKERRDPNHIISFLNATATTGHADLAHMRGQVFELHAHHVLARGGCFRWRWGQGNEQPQLMRLQPTEQLGIRDSLAALPVGVTDH